MNVDQLKNEALHLDPKSRAVLAEAIWESLEDPFTTPDMSDQEALELALQRDTELNRGDCEPLAHEELMGKLRS